MFPSSSKNLCPVFQRPGYLDVRAFLSPHPLPPPRGGGRSWLASLDTRSGVPSFPYTVAPTGGGVTVTGPRTVSSSSSSTPSAS